jgi:aryl-alcohol dehydrogenase-like predicted oxidoreductase
VSRRAELPRYGSLQPEYNVSQRAGYEAELETLCREEQMGARHWCSGFDGFAEAMDRRQAQASV